MPSRKAFAYTGGFFRNRQVRRILELSGYEVTLGLPPRNAGLVAIWGRKRRAARGQFVARWRRADLVNVEDGFLRSVLTGRSGVPPQSLVLDRKGVYFDCENASELEDLLNFADLSSGDLTARAEAGIRRLKSSGLSKYNGFDPSLEVGEDGFVLVIDQTYGDASIRYGGADAASFRKMLTAARAENPKALILIKSHPEVVSRHRRGHFKAVDLDDNMRLIVEPLSPWRLLEKARKVYCVTSLMGFEAILTGHRPRVFGRPFYGGWGLSDDVQGFARRERVLSRAELFAAVMLLYPKYYDPYRDRLCDFETMANNLEAQARAWHEDCRGYASLGMRMWKRRHLRQFFRGAGKMLSFEKDVLWSTRTGRRGLIWASRLNDQVRQVFARAQRPLLQLEDGFLRSNGLGADLVAPMSLVVDDIGIYYDPTRESRLERLLNGADGFDEVELSRAARLRERLIASGLSKYNIGEKAVDADWPIGARILVPGQVEDDASIQYGAGDVRRNIELLARVRSENPDAFIVYKPHPDVEAGLREGAIPKAEAMRFADVILHRVDAVAAIELCDAVWTITSLLGFEALLRAKHVTCLGVPFYAGWGLTHDLGSVPDRRVAKVSLDGLVHAVLIAYPRYYDPVSRLACPVEVVVERLEGGAVRPGNRWIAKLQGVFASFAPLWR